jgi:hypothetical protein
MTDPHEEVLRAASEIMISSTYQLGRRSAREWFIDPTRRNGGELPHDALTLIEQMPLGVLKGALISTILEAVAVLDAKQVEIDRSRALERRLIEQAEIIHRRDQEIAQLLERRP